MSWWQQGAASTTEASPVDGAGQRVVGGGVAGVQREHHLGRRRRAATSSIRPDHEAAPRLRQPQPGGDLLVVASRLLLDVDPDQADRQPAQPGEQAVRGEGEVGVAAPEVDDPQRLRRRRACAAGPCRARRTTVASSSRRQLLDLAVLVAAGRLHPPLGGRRCRARAAAGRPRRSAGPCRGRGLARAAPPRRGRTCTLAAPFLVTRSWSTSAVVSTCQLPNGSPSSASTAAAAASASWLAVCAWVASYVVTCSRRPALRST